MTEDQLRAWLLIELRLAYGTYLRGAGEGASADQSANVGWWAGWDAARWFAAVQRVDMLVRLLGGGGRSGWRAAVYESALGSRPVA